MCNEAHNKDQSIFSSTNLFVFKTLTLFLFDCFMMSITNHHTNVFSIFTCKIVGYYFIIRLCFCRLTSVPTWTPPQISVRTFVGNPWAKVYFDSEIKSFNQSTSNPVHCVAR